MNRPTIKDLMYGGVVELMRNRQYYYSSEVSSNYNYWTDEGKQALADYMNLVAGKMWEAEQSELDARARELVLKELRDKN